MSSAHVVHELQRPIFRCDVLILRRLARSTDNMPEFGNIKAETKQFGTMKLDDFLEHPQSYAQKWPSTPSPDRLKVEPRPTPGRHKGEAK